MSSIDPNALTGASEPPRKHRTTMAAEGLPRLALTVDDVYKMVEAGILHEDDRVELVEGELVPMSPKGNRHEVLKARLNIFFARQAPKGVTFVPETTFRLSERTYLEPDFVFFEDELPLAELNGANALLVVEVADSSLSYDRGRKARLYASYGVRELWVIDAVKLVTFIYRNPEGGFIEPAAEKSAQERLEAQLIPSLGVTLSGLALR
ncbi:MAG: Uma2 family endonuclease [Rhodomicrobium sp.]|jgi:Uma2 family endonuclease